MASATLFSFYYSRSKYEPDQFVSFDEDNSVALSSFKLLDPLTLAPSGNSYTPSIKESVPRIDNSVKESKFRIDNLDRSVEVKNVVLSYGKGKKSVPALRGINLSVPLGGIYGLLGPSGCGKTTLLRCIIGRLQPEKGEIRVFGHAPGSKGSAVPGPAIGYMPQELALFPDFTIEETLQYFARLFRMENKDVTNRIDFLVKFLQIPDKKRLVGNLSGGQKRRVSLAASLVHNPPLLILDEPTVGVDPVLRQTIWDYLVNLTSNGNLTVLITTHYIEEARAANMVGLMRSGRLLIEASPNFLLHRFNLPTLEEVFLRLCQLDPTDIELTKEAIETKNYLQQTLAVDNKPDVCTNTSPDINSSHKIKNGDIQTIVVSNGYANHDKKNTVLEQESSTYLNSYARTSALFHKNVTRLRRNLPVLLFQFLLPSIEVILFCICIGRDPFNIPIAVVNNESPADLSEWFLQTFDNNTIVQKNYISPESAIRAVKNGDSWAALIIGQNFSYALKLRTLLGGSVDNDTVIQSNIEVYLDMTNHLIGYKLQRTLLETFQKFAKEVLVSMSQNPAVVEIPIDFKPPVYGEREPTFTEFMAPGVLLSIAFLAAVALTTLAFVLERKEGLLERSLVAGVTSLEFLISHVLTQLLVLFVQVCLLLIFTFLVFNIPSRGNFFLVVLLTLLQGICGMAFGLMISSICKEENSATMLSLGSFYPNLLLSGTVWPTQAMPVFMRYFSYCLPQTLPIEAMRFILSRGWGMEYIEVTTGFVVTIAWTVFFLTSAVIIFKVKK